jgi:hypothetical protein
MQVYPSRSRFVIEGRTRASKGLRARSAEGVGEGLDIAAGLIKNCPHPALNQKRPPQTNFSLLYPSSELL